MLKHVAISGEISPMIRSEPELMVETTFASKSDVMLEKIVVVIGV
jgi:hypothetical protein